MCIRLNFPFLLDLGNRLPYDWRNMKKTLFLTIVAAAGLGENVFAADYIPTYCKGLTFLEGNDYFGAYSTTEDARRGELSIFRLNDTGPDFSSANIYGGYSSAAAATGNTVTMDSGQVGTITGGVAKSTASNNLVAVSDGIIVTITGGVAWSGNAQDNVITVTGGQAGAVTGGTSPTTAYQNIITVTGGTVGTITGGVGETGFA